MAKHDAETLVSTDTAERLRSLSASIVADATGGAGVVAGQMRRFSGTGTVAGRAVTAECADGSLMAVFGAVEHARPGDVLCMTAPGSTAYLGDLLATDLVNRGIVATVVDGLVRDTDTLATLSASFFARGATPAARRGDAPGRAMVPIEIGGVRVAPGDWIIADGDGVVVVPPERIEDVLAKAEEDARREERIMARIVAGEAVMDAVRAEIGSGTAQSDQASPDAAVE